jgi:hypothetical protein
MPGTGAKSGSGNDAFGWPNQLHSRTCVEIVRPEAKPSGGLTIFG